MGLFQKQEFTNTQPLYTLDHSRKVLIVGLGNIGKEYDGTRHNIGFDVLDEFAISHSFPAWKEKANLRSFISNAELGNSKVILAKPTTFMNDSGHAVKLLQQYFEISNESTLILHDELDVDFGSIKTKQTGGSAGHNGLKSVIEHCGATFSRVRIGIGPKLPAQIDSADFVLQRFKKEEAEHMDKLRKETINILNEFIFSGGQLPEDTRKFII